MRNLILTAVALIALSRGGLADDFKFEPTRYPFLPSLTVNNDPGVCPAFLEVVTAAFKSDAYKLDLTNVAWEGVQGEWLFADDMNPGPEVYDYPLGTDEGPKTRIVAAPVDLDADGKTQILAAVTMPFNWEGDWHALVVYRSRADFDAAIHSSGTEKELTAKAMDTSPGAGNAIGDFAATWRERRAAKVNGTYFALRDPEVYQDDTAFSLWRLSAKAGAAKACEVRALPEGEGFSLGPLKTDQAVADFAALVATVSGEEAANSGTMHAQAGLLIDAGRSVSRLAVRPWALPNADLYNSRAAIDADLPHWAASGLYQYRLHRAWPEAERKARASLAEYYAAAFGLPADIAQRASDAAVDALIRSYFIFAAAGYPDLPDKPYRGLTHALLERRPRTEIEAMLKSGYRIRPAATAGRDPEDGPNAWPYFPEEPTLFYALESAENVNALLVAGADPNAKGNFDKTALMYAAQYDLVDTARLLLERGAEPNAVTAESGEETLMQHTKRTALMYAAENGSPGLIRLLLQHGADPAAKDSSSRSILDYLALNRKLSTEDRAAIIAELREQP
jgi:hypothetical protein